MTSSVSETCQCLRELLQTHETMSQKIYDDLSKGNSAEEAQEAAQVLLAKVDAMAKKVVDVGVSMTRLSLKILYLPFSHIVRRGRLKRSETLSLPFS